MIIVLLLDDGSEIEPGDRVPMTQEDVNSLYSAIGYTAGVLGVPDITRGRVFDGVPGNWHFWNTDGQRINILCELGKVTARITVDADPTLPEPLE